MNKVFLIGRLVRDPELRFSSNKNLAISRFTLAVDRGFKRDGVDFISCVAFGKSADFVSKYLIKGTKISLMGNVHTSSYTGGNGTKHYNTDIIVESIEFAGAKVTSETDSSVSLDSTEDDLAFIETWCLGLNTFT